MTLTCHAQAQAVKLKALVDEAGNVMPAALCSTPMDCSGPWVMKAEEPQPAQPAVTVSDLCSLYLAAKEASPMSLDTRSRPARGR